MRRRQFVGLLIILGMTTINPVGELTARQEYQINHAVITRQIQSEEILQEALTYLNQARSKPCKCGNKRYPAAPPLVYNEKLAVAAQKHASWMATNLKMTHNQPRRNVANSWDRISQEGYEWSLVEENIAAGQQTAREVVDGWIQSPGHCQNLMNSSVKEIGLGLQYTPKGNYHYYWVADFATPQKLR